MRIGWWSLLLFLTLGSVLEALHGFKIGWYLDVDNETRRLMLRLAHAHGTLFAIINIAFGLTVRQLSNWNSQSRKLASFCLFVATPLVPIGFLGGGLFFQEGDPGISILLVPAGALLLFVGVALTARGIESLGNGNIDSASSPEETESPKTD